MQTDADLQVTGKNKKPILKMELKTENGKANDAFCRGRERPFPLPCIARSSPRRRSTGCQSMRAVFGPPTVRRTVRKKSMKSRFFVQRTSIMPAAGALSTRHLPPGTSAMSRVAFTSAACLRANTVENYVRRHSRSRLQRTLLRVTLDAVPCVNGAHPCEQILRGRIFSPLADHIVQCVLHDDHF